MRLVELIMLARMMSQRYGVNVTISTDGKSAYAKSFKAYGKRKFMIALPCVEDAGKFDRMTRGYLDHEIGHVLFTNFDLVDNIQCSPSPSLVPVHNIIEDVYIEGRMGKLYPGAAVNMRWLARNVFTPDMAYDTVEKFLRNLSLDTARDFLVAYTLYKRRSLADPAFAHSDELFDHAWGIVGKHFPKLGKVRPALDALLREPVSSTKEAVKLAKHIVSLIDSFVESVFTNQNAAARGMTWAVTPDSVKDETDAALQAAKDKAGEPMTGKFMRRNRRDLTVDAGRAFSAAIRVNNAALEKDIDTFGCQLSLSLEEEGLRLQEKWRGVSMDSDHLAKYARLRSMISASLPSLLQSMQYKPCRTGYTGRLADRRLHLSGVGDGRLFHHKAERSAQAVNVALLLDISGSMSDISHDVHTVLYAMLDVLKSIPGVKASAAAYARDNMFVISKFGDRRIGEKRYCFTGGNTPTAGAVLKTVLNLPVEADTRRIVFVITDGEPDSVGAFESAVQIARYQGVEVYGVALGYAGRSLPRVLGEDNYILAKDVYEFPKQLTEMMKKALVKAVAA